MVPNGLNIIETINNMHFGLGCFNYIIERPFLAKKSTFWLIENFNQASKQKRIVGCFLVI
jgi:hypothetical protein